LVKEKSSQAWESAIDPQALKQRDPLHIQAESVSLSQLNGVARFSHVESTAVNEYWHAGTALQPGTLWQTAATRAQLITPAQRLVSHAPARLR
jgi:hypothetical protein